MPNELVKYQPMDIKTITTLADVFVKSGRFATEKSVAQAAVKILAGQELGLGPVQSMTNIDVISGKIALSAGLLASLIKSSGKYDYRVVETDNKHCKLEFFENDQSLGFSEFTEADAKQAGLLGKDNWSKYPSDMYFARALTRGKRRFCPDVGGGPVYTQEELQMGVDDNDDLRDMDWDTFVELIRANIKAEITAEDVKNDLKGAGFGWTTSSKRAMYDYIETKYGDDIVDGSVTVLTD